MSRDFTPYLDISVVFDQGYINVCSTYAGIEHEKEWLSLGDLLKNRPYWYCSVDSYKKLGWCYANDGGSWLSIDVSEHGIFNCFDYYKDDNSECTSIKEVEQWMLSREAEAKEKGLVFWRSWPAADNWKTLETRSFRMLVDFGKIFMGRIAVVPEDQAFGANMSELLDSATKLLGDFLGVPEEKRASIKFEVTLTSRATSALR